MPLHKLFSSYIFLSCQLKLSLWPLGDSVGVACGTVSLEMAMIIKGFYRKFRKTLCGMALIEVSFTSASMMTIVFLLFSLLLVPCFFCSASLMPVQFHRLM